MLAPFFKKKDLDPVSAAEPAARPMEETEQAADASAESAAQEPSRTAAPMKGRMDKLSLDLIGVAEQMIQAKQLTEQKIVELEDRLHQAGGHIDRLTRDNRGLDKMIEERDRSIAELEKRLAGKNLKVDQVLEDYRELQSAMSAEVEGLKGLLYIEKQKYRTLLQKHNDAQAEKTRKISELEEKIAKAEIENTHLKSKYDAQRQEKAYLDRMINDFTSRMAAPYDPAGKERQKEPGEL